MRQWLRSVSEPARTAAAAAALCCHWRFAGAVTTSPTAAVNTEHDPLSLPLSYQRRSRQQRMLVNNWWPSASWLIHLRDNGRLTGGRAGGECRAAGRHGSGRTRPTTSIPASQPASASLPYNTVVADGRAVGQDRWLEVGRRSLISHASMTARSAPCCCCCCCRRQSALVITQHRPPYMHYS